MRELTYVLSNGIAVKTLHAAKDSGLSYKVEVREISPEKAKLTPVRKAMIEQFGYVHKSLKDKVRM